MERWQEAGGRIKAEWVGMLEAMASRSAEPVKLPFVPVRLTGRSLRAVLSEVLPMILGSNPSLLTVIRRGGECLQAYAEDASGGAYEKLTALEVRADATREGLAEQARRAGIEPGVVKTAETRFFELFAEEPQDLVGALAVLASAGAAALRGGLLSFTPALPLAELAARFDLGVDTTRDLLGRLLPDGRYGIGLLCAGGSCALALEVAGGRWTLEEAPCAAGAPGGDVRPGYLARALVDDRGCGVAVALRLADLRALVEGRCTVEDLLAGRGARWDVVSRLGVEGLLRLVPWLTGALGLERDLETCGVSLSSIVALCRDYLAAAARHVREKGLRVRLSDLPRDVDLLVDAAGLHEAAAPGAPPAGRADAGAGAAPLGLDLPSVRGAIAALAADPTAALQEYLPREILDEASYATAVVALECVRPAGRLYLFGGPHRFFHPGWCGDACAVFVDRRGRAAAVERPELPLGVSGDGRRVTADLGRLGADATFEPVRARRDRHGVGRFLDRERIADWLPGIAVERSLLRFVAGAATLDGARVEIAGGWMFLERGTGRLLRWPFGATWHYASWLMPDGACGSMVHAAPMLGASTPGWWRRFVEGVTDGACALGPGADAAAAAPPASAYEPGPPARVVRDCAAVDGRALRYRVLSAAAVPFDDDGQCILRLRCLCGAGAGLVELPVVVPRGDALPAACAATFVPGRATFAAGGRTLLSVETGASTFLGPYEAPRGILARALGRLAGRR